MAQNNYSIEDIIKIARPKSAESSIKAYARLIRKIKTGIPSALVNPNDPTHAWINDIDKIEDNLKRNNYEKSTKRNYYVALMIYIEGINGGSVAPHIWTKLDNWIHCNNYVEGVNKEYMDKQKKGELTESQKKNMATKDEIVEMLKEMKKNLPHQIVPYVLFNIYLELPVRNEIATLKMMRKIDYNRLVKHRNDTDNYLVLEKNKMFIIRNKFKTSKSVISGGRKVDELSKPLRRIITNYIKHLHKGNIEVSEDLRLFPSLYPKPNKDGDMPAFSTPELNLTKLLTRTTEKLINKKISTTILAKLTISDTLVNTPSEEVPQQLINIADTRGTALNNLVPIYSNNNDDSGGSDGS